MATCSPIVFSPMELSASTGNDHWSWHTAFPPAHQWRIYRTGITRLRELTRLSPKLDVHRRVNKDNWWNRQWRSDAFRRVEAIPVAASNDTSLKSWNYSTVNPTLVSQYSFFAERTSGSTENLRCFTSSHRWISIGILSSYKFYLMVCMSSELLWGMS